MIRHRYFFSIISIQEIARTIPYTFLTIYILNNGFNLSDYSFIKTLAMVAIFSFEVPSGWLSDKFGRKKIWMLSVVLFLIASIMYLIMEVNKYTVFPAEIIYGIGFAALTGTIQSSKINEIKHEEPNYLKNFYSDTKIFKLISRTIGSLIGGTIFVYTSFNPYYISIILFSILIIYSFNYKDYQPNIGIIAPKTSLKVKFHHFIKEKFIYLLASSLMMQFVIVVTFNYWQPIFKESFSYSRLLVPYAFIFFNISGILGSIVSKKILTNKKSIYIAILLLSAPLIIINFSGNNISALFLITFISFAKGIYDPKFNHLINMKIKDNRRGFITSLLSSIGNGLGIIISIIIGVFLKSGHEIKDIMMVFGIIFALFNSLFVFLALKQTRKIR
ncbi:MAG: MFS transporter [Mycoplasmatales bacterium]|nr:MFS transporter [Mycoplasmatales bacterium]